MTRDDLLDLRLARECAACGATLPRPGEPCGACGELPPVLRAEALEELASDPGALARAEEEAIAGQARAVAEALRAEARALQAAMREKLLAADRAEHLARLDAQARAAQARLAAALEQAASAAAALGGAVAAEAQAAERVAGAEQAHKKARQSEECARRMREGPEAEIEARFRLDAATAVLGRYRQEHAAASEARSRAERQLSAAERSAAELEAEHDTAARAAEAPGYVPRTRETVAADLVVQAASGELSTVDRAMAGIIAHMVLAAAGMGDGLPSLGPVPLPPAPEPERTPDGLAAVTWMPDGTPVIAPSQPTAQQAADAIWRASQLTEPDASAAAYRDRMAQEAWQGSDPGALAAARQQAGALRALAASQTG